MTLQSVPLRRGHAIGRACWMTIWSIITGLAFGAFFPFLYLKLNNALGGNDFLFGTILLPVAFVVDALCMAIAGQSLGRAIVGIRVTHLSGSRLSFHGLLIRNAEIYFKGMALGIPIFALFTMSNSHSRIKAGSETIWDATRDTRVLAISASIWRTTFAAILYIGILVGVQTWSRERASVLETQVPRSQPFAAADPIEDQLRASVLEIKPSLPKNVDAITVLRDVRVEGRTMIYSYDISRRDVTDDSFAKFLQKSPIPQVCRNNDMRKGIDQFDIIYRYEYRFPHSTEPMVVSIDRATCAKL